MNQSKQWHSPSLDDIDLEFKLLMFPTSSAGSNIEFAGLSMARAMAGVWFGTREPEAARDKTGELGSYRSVQYSAVQYSAV